MTQETMTGGCLCGDVKFTAHGVQTNHHVCHCEMCHRFTGGSMMGIKSQKVEFSGEDNIGRYTSSDWAERGFCKKCGSSLFYFAKPTQEYFVPMGLFDDRDKFQLTKEIFIDRKPRGYAFKGDLPSMTEAEVFAAFASS